MKHIKLPWKLMSISVPLKLHLIALVNLLVLIATLLLVALGSTIYESMDHMWRWLATVGTTLLTLTIVPSFINSMRQILMWKRSSSGGSQTSIEPCKSLESLEENHSCQVIRGSSSTGLLVIKDEVKPDSLLIQTWARR